MNEELLMMHNTDWNIVTLWYENAEFVVINYSIHGEILSERHYSSADSSRSDYNELCRINDMISLLLEKYPTKYRYLDSYE